MTSIGTCPVCSDHTDRRPNCDIWDCRNCDWSGPFLDGVSRTVKVRKHNAGGLVCEIRDPRNTKHFTRAEGRNLTDLAEAIRDWLYRECLTFDVLVFEDTILGRKLRKRVSSHFEDSPILSDIEPTGDIFDIFKKFAVPKKLIVPTFGQFDECDFILVDPDLNNMSINMIGVKDGNFHVTAGFSNGKDTTPAYLVERTVSFIKRRELPLYKLRFNILGEGHSAFVEHVKEGLK